MGKWSYSAKQSAKFKRQIAKLTGIPTTKSGRKAKSKRLMRKMLGLPPKSRKKKSKSFLDIILKDF